MEWSINYSLLYSPWNYFIHTSALRFVFATTDVYKINVPLFTGFLVTFVLNALVRDRRELQMKSLDLKKTSKRLRRVMDSIYTMVYIIDRKGNIQDVSKSFTDKFNLEVPHVINKNIFNFEPWSNNSDLKNLLSNALENVTTDNAIKFEHSLVINNQLSFAEISVTAIVENNFEDIVLTVRDRTDKKLYEDELMKSKIILSKLIDSNIIGMTVANIEGELIETNDRFLQMIGYTPEEFMQKGLKWGEITPLEAKDISNKKVGELIKTGVMTVFEKEYYHKDGHIVPVLVTGVAINKGQALCLILDLTPQKTLQKKKDEFISVASHELKTPMTVIKGYLQLLSKKLSKSPEDYSNFLNIIDFQLDKLNTLVNELHDISKIESNKLRMHFEELNLNELVKNSINEVNPFIENHQIKFVENIKDIILTADIIRLEQVLINLLTNAIKYSPNGGEIIVSVNKDLNNAIVSVQDFGEGIPESNIKDIFTKYFQVEENRELREGLGLGLYISAEIIKHHNGKITVQSQEGKGSTFSIQIPIQNN